MRRLLLATAAALLVAAAPAFTPAFAQVKDANSIIQELSCPHAGGAASGEGSTNVACARGIKHIAAPAAAKAAPAAAADTQAASSSLIVLFGSGSADLTNAGRVQLDQLGKALQDPALAGKHFRIEGHTDTTGDAETNKALSERRAGAVVDYLASRYGLDRSKFVAVGMGKEGLAVPTPDQTNEPRNRRVVLINLDG